MKFQNIVESCKMLFRKGVLKFVFLR